MKITSIEVIRKNPAGNPVAIGVPVGEKLPVEVGDTVRTHLAVDYRGDDVDGAVWTAIGWQTGIIIPEFIEAYNNRTPVHFAKSVDFVTQEIVCDVPIEPVNMPIEFGLYGNALDIYAKIMEVPGPDIFTDPLYQVIEVVGVEEGEYEEVQHTTYPWAYTYEGDAETCTFEFRLTPEQVPLTEWMGDRIVDSFANALRNEGARLLELWVYRDTAPTLWTNYRVKVKATVEPQVAGVALGLVWSLIILGVLAILFVIAIVYAIKAIDEIVFHRKPLSDETKAKFDRDTLVQMVLDLRPETPLATLEEMSDDEVRHHLNEILAEEAPDGIGWGVIAVVGGVAVAGVAAAFVLSRRE